MKKISAFYYLIFFFLFSTYSVISSANELEIVNLNFRPASQIIPLVKPLLDKNGTISGEKYVLFIKTSRNNFNQIMEAVKILDAELRQLRISIMQESATTMKQFGFNASHKNKTTRAKILSTNRVNKNARQQTIQVTEGQWATLQTGISVPSISRTKNSDGTVTESVKYQSIITRIKIRPVINADKVVIKIKSSTGLKSTTNTGAGQAHASHGLNTQVTGYIGEWIALGGIRSADNNSGSGFIFSTHRNSESMRQIFIKVNITTYQD